MKTVELFTDGACSGNPGPGGWAAILRYAGTKKELAGGEASTTNNRMELTAVLEGLGALKESCHVRLTSDSRYVTDSVSKGWLHRWAQNNWIKPDKNPALNADLWQKLLPLLEMHRVEFIWIRGHDGHAENERCDKLATAQAKLAGLDHS